MKIDDYDAVIGLMRATPGVTVRDADSREATALYLERNPGLSFVAEHTGRIAGCIMSGHDGRRGYLQHLIVLPAFRRQGIASALVERCLEKLAQLGILKAHVDVFTTNEPAIRFWEQRGWKMRDDIHRFSFISGKSLNA